MTTRVYEWLSRWHETASDENANVFSVKVTIKTVWTKICCEAGIEDFHFHDSRATCITRMIEAGIPHTAVMRVSGHNTLSCLYRYIRADADTVFRAAAALDTLHAEVAKAQTTATPELIN